jgi:hypothetical protein
MKTPAHGFGIVQGPDPQAIDRVKINVEIFADARETANGCAKLSNAVAWNDAIHVAVGSGGDFVVVVGNDIVIVACVTSD